MMRHTASGLEGHGKIWDWDRYAVVGPKDGGFGFDQSKKYTSIDNIDEICVQCQAGQHRKCLKKSKRQDECECEHCMIYG